MLRAKKIARRAARALYARRGPAASRPHPHARFSPRMYYFLYLTFWYKNKIQKAILYPMIGIIPPNPGRPEKKYTTVFFEY